MINFEFEFFFILFDGSFDSRYAILDLVTALKYKIQKKMFYFHLKYFFGEKLLIYSWKSFGRFKHFSSFDFIQFLLTNWRRDRVSHDILVVNTSAEILLEIGDLTYLNKIFQVQLSQVERPIWIFLFNLTDHLIAERLCEIRFNLEYCCAEQMLLFFYKKRFF